jgi:hypothetical protein
MRRIRGFYKTEDETLGGLAHLEQCDGHGICEHQGWLCNTAFSRDFKKKGMIALSTYLRQYKVGDIVDVVCNGAVQKGMP